MGHDQVAVPLARRLVSLAFVGWATAPAAATIDFWGFSMAPHPTQVGETLAFVGVVAPQATDLPWPTDFQTNEYTVSMAGATVRSVEEDGAFLVVQLTGGVFDVFEDSARNAPFAYYTDPAKIPPLDAALVPRTFQDGLFVARFEFDGFVWVWHPSTGLGAIGFDATELEAAGGDWKSRLVEAGLGAPWHMGGAFTDNAGAWIPPGYGMRWDAALLVQESSAVDAATWGAIKRRFR